MPRESRVRQCAARGGQAPPPAAMQRLTCAVQNYDWGVRGGGGTARARVPAVLCRVCTLAAPRTQLQQFSSNRAAQCAALVDPCRAAQVAELCARNSGVPAEPGRPYAEFWVGTHPSGPSQLQGAPLVDCCLLSEGAVALPRAAAPANFP